ncbi:hypothetical protein EC973_005599 [Apophysomyces ossiformis]|uniref:PIN domain-containing protein n=1 Tax=Apophysomyces ossiformis TaxID=679940 RepID=A0A8H7BS35_9FUNG|nr:hypothetical protein EC973_005599 [Apophysomyces ossiformis]
MSQHEIEYMDIDEAEFIHEVNVEIAHIRANATVDVQKYTDPLEVPGTGDDWPFCHIAVLDTNFLISHLAYLKNLLTKAEQHPGSLVLVVPWIVVMELDGLKVREDANHSNTKCNFVYWMLI